MLHLQDKMWSAKDIAAKFGLREECCREILARREAASRSRAGIYCAGRPHKRGPSETAMSFVG
jgi:hypothetical protein